MVSADTANCDLLRALLGLSVRARLQAYVLLSVWCVRGPRPDDSDWEELRRAVILAEANGVRCT